METAANLGWRQRLAAVPRSTREFLLDGVASPTAPLVWLAKLQPAGRAPRWWMTFLKADLVIIWSVCFVWVWFPLFFVMLLWETFAPRES